eukprot:TRINITY_DN5262_c0_g1_i10.p1 TRINITY_DN5262_c0_g1~~TRINITY_DN5262_c0_g1_i10.p1  ORF type:complete len:373 (-),score=24.01 TRINITY_DN5262_c0_g1_i10:412-1416(-)
MEKTQENKQKNKRTFLDMQQESLKENKLMLSYEGLLAVAKFADSCKQISSINVSDDVEEVFSILTYNIWFEPLEMQSRVDAIIRIISEQGYPEVIMLQEVVRESYIILRDNCLLRFLYHFSDPVDYSYFTTMMVKKSTVKGQKPIVGTMEYGNSQMGRGVLFCCLDLFGRRICFGTTHLESVFASAYASKKIKTEQLQQAVECLLEECPNVILAGDFNWNEDKEGELETDGGLTDAWTKIYPNNPGYTYDGKLNRMIYNRYRNRLDRVLYSLEDVEAKECMLVGQTPIPNVLYTKQAYGKEVTLPVFPSDHFGLLVKFSPKLSKENQQEAQSGT